MKELSEVAGSSKATSHSISKSHLTLGRDLAFLRILALSFLRVRSWLDRHLAALGALLCSCKVEDLRMCACQRA